MKIGDKEKKVGAMRPDLESTITLGVTLKDFGQLIENQRKRASYLKRLTLLEEEEMRLLKKYTETK